MTRRLRIPWEPGSKVTGLLSGPGEGELGILLAHGAGAGQRHPFMEGLRRRIGDAGFPVLTFDYPYVEAGRSAPDRPPRLLAAHRAAYDRLSDRCRRILIAGKSMGGRMGGHLVAEHDADAAGLLFLGYPLVALGKDVPRDTSHLEGCDVSMLFIQGERDRLGPPDQVGAVVDRIPRARMEVVDSADHGFRVPKRSGDFETTLDRLAASTLAFARDVA